MPALSAYRRSELVSFARRYYLVLMQKRGGHGISNDQRQTLFLNKKGPGDFTPGPNTRPLARGSGDQVRAGRRNNAARRKLFLFILRQTSRRRLIVRLLAQSEVSKSLGHQE